MESKNILYFEGAGMNFYSKEQTDFSDVGNFRIRTAFQNLNGKKFYIELGNGTRYDMTKKKPKKITDYAMYIDHLHEITNNHDDENNSRIKYDFKEIRKLDYTKENITQWINRNLNCNFDTIEVLDRFYGYRVHGNYKNGKKEYNFMEDIELNHDRTKMRKQAYNSIDNFYKNELGERFSKINLLDMNSEGITIRCHASDEKLNKIGLPREKFIPISY